MEKNINLAKILNGKSVNTKLWSPLFGDAYTSSICSEDTIIVVNHHAESSSFYNNGKYFDYAEAEPLLFPSKEMRDWGKFAWKKGDLLINSCGFQCIFKQWASDDYTKFNGCYSNSRDGYEDVTNAETAKFDKLDNNIAYGYIREIERKLGGILNLTTLKIEMKSKVEIKPFDKVLVRNDKEDQWSANIFSYQVRDMYHCLGEDYWRYCIPYIGNESLLGTTKDVEG
jgi:hypothetical protein